MTNFSSLSHPKYRSDIDGLRAIAVLSVIGFHAFPNWINGGFIGVDVFFVISGFLISTIIFKNLDNGKFNFIEFYFRRIKRIFPALIFILVTCYTIGWFLLSADEYKQLGKHIAGGAIFISNFVLWKEAGYFDTLAETKPLLHLWSLSIEEQFYIVWPFLLWVASKRKYNLLSLTIIIAIISFYLNITRIRHNSIVTFYSPQTRFWELLCGSILAWLSIYPITRFLFIKKKLDNWLGSFIYRQTPVSDKKTLANVLSFSGLVLLVYGIYRINKDLSFPGKWACIPVLGSMLLISAGPSAWFNRTILSNRLLVWIGLISFPLYLWHWPLLSFLRIVEGDVPSKCFRLLAVVFSVLFAWLTYRFIERPIRFAQYSFIKTVLLISSMFIIGYVGFNSYIREGLSFRAIAKQSQDFHYADRVDGYKSCDQKELISDNIALSYCFYNMFRTATAAIIGDSHAADKFHGLVKNDSKNVWMLLGNSSCPPVLHISVEGDQKDCQKKFEKIFNYLANNKEIELVALSFFGNYFKNDLYAADHIRNTLGPLNVKISSHSSINQSKIELFYLGLDNAIKFLIDHNKQVVLFIDVPELPFFPKDCWRNHTKNCMLRKTDVLARQDELRKLIEKLKNSNPTISIFDPINLLCSEKFCSYKKDGIIVYRDSHHLSERGSDLFSKSFLSNQ